MGLTSLRILLALANENNWPMKQCDIKTLHGVEKKGCHATSLDTELRKLKFKRLRSDPSVYIGEEQSAISILGIYFDVMLNIGSSENAVSRTLEELSKKFEIKNVGEPTSILGLDIAYNKEEGYVAISQTNYIRKLLEEQQMDEFRPVSTPMTRTEDEATEWMEGEKELIPYKSVIRSLMFLAQASRPDIAFATQYLSGFSRSFTPQNWKQLKRILHYLQGSSRMGMVYRRNGKKIHGASDANFNSWCTDGKSTSGYVFFVSDCAISWNSVKQKSVGLSTCETEYMAMCEAFREGKWIQSFVEELKMDNFIERPLKMATDSEPGMELAKRIGQSERSKHIELRFHYVKDEIEKGNFELYHVGTKMMAADMFTKPVNKKTMTRCSTVCGLSFI